MPTRLFNKVGKQALKKELGSEDFHRRTLSFYRYVTLEDPTGLRDTLYLAWDKLNIFGRVYLATEGINAQMSVPEQHWDLFVKQLYEHDVFNKVEIKHAIEDDGKSFYKLIVRVREKILGDGLPEGKYDFSNVGTHLNAEQFNQAVTEGKSLIVDMRNYYESEVGRFQGALLPEEDTFRDTLPKTLEMLQGKENDKILLYCTGGIRCEKASAYLKHHGFQDVNQIYGGIIAYSREVKSKGLKSSFIGKNFVFDERLGERISDEVIAECHQCGESCDTHTNCLNNDCHLLFIQCEQCKEQYSGCCSPECQQIASLPMEEQRKLRKGKDAEKKRNIYRSRVRPNLKEILKAK